MSWVPSFERFEEHGRLVVRLGDPLVDLYLEFVGLRLRQNSVLAVAYDLKVFFTVITKAPSDVRAPDVFEFLADQRRPRHDNVVRLIDGEAGLSSRTIRRRLSSVAGFDWSSLPSPASVLAFSSSSAGASAVPR